MRALAPAVLSVMIAACDSPTKPNTVTAAPSPVTLTSVAPTEGWTDEPSQLTIAGLGFAPGATVTLGSVAATVTSLSATRITVSVAPQSAGPVDVTVTNPDGATARLSGGFRFRARPTPDDYSRYILFVHTPAAAPSSPTDSAVGRYALKLDVDDCDVFPPASRQRAYTADVAPDGDGYFVTLSGAAFLNGQHCLDVRFPLAAPVCNRFRATRSENTMLFDFNPSFGFEDLYEGNVIFESLPDGTWVHMGGSASGALQSGTIEATGRVVINRWLGFPGRAPWSQCSARQLRMTFTSVVDR